MSAVPCLAHAHTPTPSTAAFLDVYDEITFEEIDSTKFDKYLYKISASENESRELAGRLALAGDSAYLPRFEKAVTYARRFHAALQGEATAQALTVSEAAEEEEDVAGVAVAGLVSECADDKDATGKRKRQQVPQQQSVSPARRHSGGAAAPQDLCAESESDQDASGMPAASAKAQKRTRSSGAAASDPSTSASEQGIVVPRFVTLPLESVIQELRIKVARRGAEILALFDALVASDAAPAFSLSKVISNLWDQTKTRGLLASLTSIKPHVIELEGPCDRTKKCLLWRKVCCYALCHNLSKCKVPPPPPYVFLRLCDRQCRSLSLSALWRISVTHRSRHSLGRESHSLLRTTGTSPLAQRSLRCPMPQPQGSRPKHL